jgi:hypothetical protein
MERSLVEELAALKLKNISVPGEFLFLFWVIVIFDTWYFSWVVAPLCSVFFGFFRNFNNRKFEKAKPSVFCTEEKILVGICLEFVQVVIVSH